jgi:hypothetical protein
MNKFVVEHPKYALGNKYLSFLLYKGNVYNIGAGIPVILSAQGRKCLIDNCNIVFAMIDQHYFKATEEYYNIRIRTTGGRYDPNFSTVIHSDMIDSYIEEVKATPICDNVQEYVDYIKEYKAHFYDEHLTEEEMNALIYAMDNNLLHEYEAPERIKNIIAQNEIKNTKCKPLFKDLEIPNLMLGWVGYFAFAFSVCVFKDWYITLLLQIVGGVYFHTWRQKKIWGIK